MNEQEQELSIEEEDKLTHDYIMEFLNHVNSLQTEEEKIDYVLYFVAKISIAACASTSPFMQALNHATFQHHTHD
jgi:hypothetical protein